MSDLRTAAQQALEALEVLDRVVLSRHAQEAITALRAALAEPVQEPVWVCPDSAEHRYQKPGHCEDCGKTLVQERNFCPRCGKRANGIHTCTPPAPPHRLTDEEIASMWHANGGFQYHFARAVERAVKRAHNITE